MKLIISKMILFLLIIQGSYAQNTSTDLSGKWTGVSQFGKEKYQLVLEMEQDGNILKGMISWSTLNKKKYGKYDFNGIKQENSIELKALKFIEKKGLACLPSYHLTLSQEPKKHTMSGKWGHNKVWGGCLWGISGKVNLEKSIEVVEARQLIVKSAPIKLDVISQEAINRLKARKNHALIIGVEAYQDEQMNDLNRPVEDAHTLTEALKVNYTFEENDIIFLNNPTRSQIIESFDLLSSKVKPTDNLLVFYAGHGIWDAKLEQGYWLPSDAKKSSKAQWLSNGTIRDYVRAIPSKHTLLIADACFSGGILKQRNPYNTTKAHLEIYKLPSRKAMTSGTLKTVPDKSVFLKYLVKKLNDNDKAIISADQLFSDLRIAVIHNSPNNQIPQYGVIHGSGDEGGDFLFLKR